MTFEQPIHPLVRQFRAVSYRLRKRVGEWHAYRAGRSSVPKGTPADAAEHRKRGLEALDVLARGTDGTPKRYRRVLVDGMWENANYWARYALVRAALNLGDAEECGLLGIYNRAASEEAFTIFGFAGRADYKSLLRSVGGQRSNARKLLRGVRTPADMMQIEFPHGLPSEMVYDGILKRQRRGSVDVRDPLLVDYVAEALQCLEAAHRLFNDNSFDFVALSHALNFDFGSLAWCGAQAGAEVVILYGDFGTQRFQRIRGRDDLLMYLNCPTPEEVASLDADERERRVLAGGRYIENRFCGASGDISALYAFQRPQDRVSRADIAQAFGWDADKPIVCVFASNWFDFPHTSNMNNFIDFHDWIDATLEVASTVDSVNWLFKPHPCDKWYGSIHGPTVADLVTHADRPHIRVVEDTWNGYSLIQAIDAGITYFGTVGVELPAIGKPVLVADEAWYAPHEFVVCAHTREGYLSALRQEWWKDFDGEEAARRAKEFIAWFFCDAEWHGDYHFRDDSEQYLIYGRLPEFLSDNDAAVDHEIDLIRSWMASDHPYYHTFKMLRSRIALSDSARSVVDIRHGSTEKAEEA